MGRGDPSDAIDKLQRAAPVLVHAGGDGQHERIDENVFPPSVDLPNRVFSTYTVSTFCVSA